jgi:SAM-dependent methyltransferase
MIFALDRDAERARAIRRRLREAEGKAVARGGLFIARQADATRLERIDDGFIDKVVTDPPWGLHDGRTEDLETLYPAALQEFCRVTKPGGIIILLLSRSGPLESLAEPVAAELSLEARHDLLVAGQKCAVLKWRRVGSGTHAAAISRTGTGVRSRALPEPPGRSEPGAGTAP